MESRIILEALKNFPNQKGIRQTTLYPNINDEQKSLVQQSFPEYDPDEEEPLLFYTDGPNWDDTVRWFMLSNTNFYCKMFYYPHSFNVVDSLPLSGIESIKIYKRVIKDNILTINEHKLGSLILYSRDEAKYLNEVLRFILNHIEKDIKIDASICAYEKDYLPERWRELHNYHLFTIVSEHFAERNLARRNWGFSGFYYGPFIPAKPLERARNLYANYDPEEESCILFVDNTFVGLHGSIEPSGFVITNKHLFYKLNSSFGGRYQTRKIELSEIHNIKIKMRFRVWLIINEGTPLWLSQFTYLSGRDVTALQEVLTGILQAIPLQKG